MCYKAKICRWFNWNLGFGNAWRYRYVFYLARIYLYFYFLVWFGGLIFIKTVSLLLSLFSFLFMGFCSGITFFVSGLLSSN